MGEANATVGGELSELGRYVLFGRIAVGGMASVHLGRLRGAVGFARTVAIKRLRRAVARDPEFVAMLIDEARIAARIRHPNVAATIDVYVAGEEVLLVLEYVHGESVRGLLRATAATRGDRPRSEQGIGPKVATAIVCGALHGLHAAHEAKSESGQALGIVHRDVSPHNILVGIDGLPRVVDFGVAKAAGRLQSTRDGQLKGKLGYMTPEQVCHDAAEPDRRTDVFAAGIVLWECLTGERLFAGDTEHEIFSRILDAPIPRPSSIARDVPGGLDDVVQKALARDRRERYATARDFAIAIENAMPNGIASQHVLGAWVEDLAGDKLRALEDYLSRVEQALPSDDAMARDSLVTVQESGSPPTSGEVHRAAPAPFTGAETPFTGADTGSGTLPTGTSDPDLEDTTTAVMSPPES